MKNTSTKIITVLSILFIINFLSGCFPDPCPPPLLFYLKDVNVQAVDRVQQVDGSYDILYTDTIRHQIGFEVRPIVEIAATQTKIPKWNLMNTAYSRCLSSFALNPIVFSETKIYTNKPIYWSGIEIPSNTNLLEHEGFKELISLPNSLDYENYALISILVEPMKFLNEPYLFTFEWKTNEGTLLTDEVSVQILI